MEDRYWMKPRKKPLEKRRGVRKDLISLASGDTILMNKREEEQWERE